MKPIHKYQENNFKKMNTSKFIQFGILAILISNSVFANGLTDNNNIFAGNISLVSTDTTNLTKPAIETEPDTIITLTAGYRKAIEDIIKEDNLIIESHIPNEEFLLDIDNICEADSNSGIPTGYKKPKEEVIKEDNQIIESNIPKAVSSLNWKSINKKTSKGKKVKQQNCFSNKCCIKL